MTIDILEVLHKAFIGIGDHFGVFGRELDLSVRIDDVVHTTALSFKLSKGQCSLAGVPNLTAIPSHFLVCFPISIGKLFDHTVFNDQLPALLLEAPFYEALIEPENLECLLEVKLGIVKTDVYARRECFVEVAKTICGKKQNTRIVF